MSTRRSKRISKKQNNSTPSSVGGPIEKYLVVSSSSKRKQSWLTPPEQEEQMVPEQDPKRQRFEIQNQWQPITSCPKISTRTLVPSPGPSTSQVPCHRTLQAAGASCYTFKNIFTSLSSVCPLPPLKWAQPQEVWSIMRSKERKYHKNRDLFSNHPQLQYRMRAILLDWIIEVCEVYRLHRETFYLAVDFIDRYLSAREDVQKYQLQLIGVTCLFIAAKLEEIYPPKLSEFAYVTDGACTAEDITKQELIILKTLKWDLCPMTVNMWMCIYLNILNHTSNDACITELKFAGHSFLVIARLMDLCTLDEGSLQFSSSLLAAAILYHFADEIQAATASGYSFNDLEECINWVAPFAITTREHSDSVTIKTFKNILPDDQHNIQTHDANIVLLDKAKQRQKIMALPKSRASPELCENISPDMLTPPPTSHKHSVDQSLAVAGGASNAVELVHSSSSGTDSDGSSSRYSFASTLSAVDDVIEEIVAYDEEISQEDVIVLD